MKKLLFIINPKAGVKKNKHFVEDALEIFVDGNQIVLKKFEPSCIFCADAKNVINYKGKNVCVNCLKELRKL